MNTKVITDVTSEPVSYDEANNYIIDQIGTNDTDNQSLVLLLIRVAREVIERQTNLVLSQKTLETYFDHTTDVMQSNIYLPVKPVSSITSIKYIDYKGNETDMTRNSNYYIRDNDETEIYLWTTFNADASSLFKDYDYKVRYIAGYGITGTDNTESLPDALKYIMLELILEFWKNRGDGIYVMNNRIKEMLAPYKYFTGW